MSLGSDLKAINDFLRCATPDAWVAWSTQHPDVLLIDHANCEKKAAATALGLMHRYTSDARLLHKLSRLAREELRHFEQVVALMEAREVPYRYVSAAGYAGQLREGIRKDEPGRLVDTLIVGAVIEARSCERFAALAPVVDAELGEFYRSLLKSEARHFQDYLALAERASGGKDVAARQGYFCDLDAKLVNSTDREFRFHSGIPAEDITLTD